MKKNLLIVVLTMLGLNSACGQQNYENIDVNGFAELVADTNVVVLDVRTVNEFAEGHLMRAINIDCREDDFVEKAKAALPLDKKIAIYCRSGRRSAAAAGILGVHGYTTVNLTGGIIAWKEAKKPVITK
jgi:rhodanese-related sulfurtransferase